MPLCEGDTCLIATVLPAGEPWQTTRVAGDFDGWVGTAPVTPITRCRVGVGHITVSFSDFTEYKLHFADGTWALDAKDRYIRSQQFGPNSAIYRPGRGRLARVATSRRRLGNVRDLYVYLPRASYFADPAARLPVFLPPGRVQRLSRNPRRRSDVGHGMDARDAGRCRGWRSR